MLGISLSRQIRKRANIAFISELPDFSSYIDSIMSGSESSSASTTRAGKAPMPSSIRDITDEETAFFIDPRTGEFSPTDYTPLHLRELRDLKALCSTSQDESHKVAVWGKVKAMLNLYYGTGGHLSDYVSEPGVVQGPSAGDSDDDFLVSGVKEKTEPGKLVFQPHLAGPKCLTSEQAKLVNSTILQEYANNTILGKPDREKKFLELFYTAVAKVLMHTGTSPELDPMQVATLVDSKKNSVEINLENFLVFLKGRGWLRRWARSFCAERTYRYLKRAMSQGRVQHNFAAKYGVAYAYTAICFDYADVLAPPIISNRENRFKVKMRNVALRGSSSFNEEVVYGDDDDDFVKSGEVV